MTSKRTFGKQIRFLALFAAAACMLGEGENEPYFALSTSRSFGSNGKPTVSLSAFGVDSLEMRVYRISDPRKFFGQLEDPHQFGGRSPRPAHETTILEKIRLWKHSVRADIRRSLRAQFTESPSAHFDRFFASKSQPATGGKEARYAEAPLLNSQQLVMSFLHKARGNSRWDREEVDVPVKDKGVYLVEGVQKDLRAYTVLMVSDLVMITKVGQGKIVNLVVDRASGQPVPNITVTAFSKAGEAAVAETGGDGIAELKTAPPRERELTVFARNDRDVAVNTLQGNPYGPNGEDWTGYIYTDRPVYRPGHTMHFKGILRLHSANGYEIPSGRKVSVEVQDADQKPIYRKTLTVSVSGAIHDDLVLAAGATLGSYTIQVKSGDTGYMSGNFDVEDYKKPEYEVRVTPSKTKVLQGQTVQAIVDARYFFGEPVSGAKVKYAVYRQRYWFPGWYDPEDDSARQGPDQDPDGAGDQVGDQEGTLDADGRLTISVPTALSDHKFDFLYRVDARVIDAANREISGTGWIIATYGSFALNVEPERYVYKPGSKGTFKIQAHDYDNNPIGAHARLVLQTWKFNEGGEPIGRATEVDLAADRSGIATLDLPQRGGTYEVRATARTPEGRDVESTSLIWVSGGTWEFDESRGEAIQIVTDKKTYRAGDTAKLMVVAGQPGTSVFVTVEGRDIRQQKVLQSQDSTVSFDVPITAHDEPGITVNAQFVRNGVFRDGSKYVRVPPVQHELTVKMATDKPQYSPGQIAEYSIDVAGPDGKPMPNAELSLGVVDEAIYGIQRDTTPSLLSFFFGHDYNRVSTANSLEYYFSGEAGRRRMQLAQLRPRSRLAQLKPERLVQPKIRKAFPDTAFWGADLVTDQSGHARAKVEFPDSLTTWRATARGITPDTKVGSLTLTTIVRKNLIVRLVVPRFFVQGDQIVISALVHNYLQEAKTAHVSLDAQGLDVLEGATREIQIPSRGEAKVDWTVRASQVHKAAITAKALTNEESDAIQMDFPVNIPGVKLAFSKGGSLAAGGSADFALTFPDKIEPGSRSLSIRVSPSIAGSLFDALDYLTSFPYGCVEQTMSSFLPNIVVKDAVASLHLKTDMDEAALQEKIRAGLDRLYSFQHPDGGWGWWETDESHPFMTAYVVAGLVQARSAGVRINPETIQKGVEWLKKDLVDDPKLAVDLKAYMAYALTVAGQPDRELLSQIYGRRSSISPYGLALLGLALEQAKDGRASEIAAALESSVEHDQEQAWWSASRDPMLDFSVDATPEATAYVTRFLSHQRKRSPLLPKAALWLMNHRDEGYWWTSTKQTAMVIYGLTDYLKSTNELTPNLTAMVFVNDKPVLTRKIAEATLLNLPELVLSEDKLQPGVNRVRVTTSGEGRLYYSTRAEYHSSDAHLEKTGSLSLNILRDYFRLTSAKDGDRIVYDTVPLNGPVSVGDIVAVRLTVTGSEWKYVMVEDPIPAGTEFIEHDNLYELRTRPPWWSYSFTRRELHDDRMAIFQIFFPQGQQEYFYLLKVVNPGVFLVSPARVEPMYQPNVMATTESRHLEVK